MQRQYNVGLSTNPGTISLAVDNNRYPRMLPPRGPERGWPGDTNMLRNRRLDGDNKCFKKLPPPGYSSAYTTDVSHLVV